MGILDKIYEGSPVAVQHLMCSAKGWMIQRRRYNKAFQRSLDEFCAHSIDIESRLDRMLGIARRLPGYKGIQLPTADELMRISLTISGINGGVSLRRL